MLSFPSRSHWLAATAVCASLTACAGGPVADGQHDSGTVQGDTIEGTADVLVAMYKDRAESRYYIETDAGLHVRVNFEVDLGTVQPGEWLSLAGRWNNEKSLSAPTFTATSMLKHLGVQRAGGDGSGNSLAAAGSGGPRAPLLHRVAVIMLNAPTSTRQQALAQVNQTAGSAGSFLNENSDGIDGFEGDVFGPYNVNTSDCPNRAYEIADLAKAAAAADGKNLQGYTNLAFLIGKGADCDFGGLGQVSRPGDTSQLLTWYNDWFDCGVVAHELGHNLGMNHSHSTACGTAMYTSKRAGCTDNEYGDVFDVMGDANCSNGGHFSAPQKQYMGWFGSCEDVTAGGSAVFNLSPSEGSCGVRSLRIPIPGETSYYYLEYRKKSAGAFGGASGADRVLISVSNDGATVRPDPYRLDSTPGSSGKQGDGWLALNTSYTLPGNVQVRLLELGAEARVQVTMPQGAGAKCHNGELAPADTSGRIGVGCSDGCPTDPNKTSPGYCGCGVPDSDTDGDGVRNCTDGCPSDPNKTDKGVCGCGVLELTCAGVEPGLIRKHYNGQWSTLPNFNQYTADSESVVSTINVAAYAGKDNFGVVFTGGVQIATAGTYDFELSSDDGSRLRIDDREVVLNDGIHGVVAKTGSVSLTAGPHAMRVEFFEGGGGENLLLRYRRSGGSFAEIPASLLVHAKAPVPDQCPNDANKTVPGVCGCGTADTDGDGDGTANCKDSCPTDRTKTAPGACGCGKAEGSCGGETSQCVVANENATAQLSCPTGQTIGRVAFSSYGTPTGTCGSFVNSTCHASTSLSAVQAACLGKVSCSVPATNAQFGDPCAGTAKRLAVAYVCQGALKPGLKRAHYSGTFSVLPAFSSLTPDAQDVASVIGVGPYANTELFGLVFTGQIQIAAAGSYEFELGSDDGSRLEIDGARVVNNDGLHGLTLVNGTVSLTAGAHTIRVEYFERTGGDVVSLRYRPAGGTMVEVPASVLFYR